MKLLPALKILVVLLVLAGCSSGKKALKKGDYDRAVAQAVNRLRSNDDHKKASSTLKKAYRLAVSVHQDNVKRAKTGNDIFKWEIISANYQQINNMYDQIIRCPGCQDVVPNPLRYDAELAAVNQEAAAVRYDLGMEAMKYKQDRIKAMEAHQHFLRARNYVPRYKDIEEKMNEAIYYATLRVVVEPIPAPVRILNVRHEFFVNKINEYLHNRIINEYVRFYTPGEAEASNLEYVDQVIRMEFDEFSLGNVSSRIIEREVSKDSVEIGKSKGEPVIGTVKATLKINEKSISGRGVLDFKIMDTSLNKVISQEKFPSNYTWSIQWASYNGDKRALSQEELDLVNTKEVGIPNPQMMFEEFTAPLFDQVINKITFYYRGV